MDLITRIREKNQLIKTLPQENTFKRTENDIHGVQKRQKQHRDSETSIKTFKNVHLYTDTKKTISIVKQGKTKQGKPEGGGNERTESDRGKLDKMGSTKLKRRMHGSVSDR